MDGQAIRESPVPPAVEVIFAELRFTHRTRVETNFVLLQIDRRRFAISRVIIAGPATRVYSARAYAPGVRTKSRLKGSIKPITLQE